MHRPKVGSLVYATVQGLGILAKQFFDHGIVDDVFVLEHHCRPNHHLTWYPGHPHAPSQPVARGHVHAVHEWVRQQDILLFFETPFDWGLIDFARKLGKRTVLMVMYECMPDPLPAMPDVILCPSLLDLQHFPTGRLVQVPVSGVPWKRRREVRTFVHNAGHGGMRGRNGTKEFLEAIPLARCFREGARAIIRCQELLLPLTERLVGTLAEQIDFRMGTVSADDLWLEGDAFVFPEKFNGLSLPLQEAFASGMAVIATDRFPMNEWLPRELLIQVNETRKARIGGCREFDEAVVTPQVIADAMDRVFEIEDVSPYSFLGQDWANDNSWDRLAAATRKAVIS